MPVDEVFRSAVREAVIPLVTGYGFTLEQDGQLARYLLTSERAQIRIGLNIDYVLAELIMRFVPIEEEQDFVELHHVVAALCPDMPEDERYPRQVREAEAVHGEVERLVCVLTGCCGSLIGGDTSLWSMVTHHEQRRRALRYPGDGESREDHIARLRTEAQGAWEDGRYWAYAEVLSYIRLNYGKLTQLERQRERVAYQHVFVMR